jgi:hypothetical protein
MKRARVFAVTVAAVALAVPAPEAAAHGRPPSLPIDVVGELRGAPFEIRVPANWNGTLVMFAHGYRDAADHPGENDDRSVSAFVNDAAEQAMLGAGFALAGSAYSANGWAVREGMHDMLALTYHFRAVTGRQPRRTLLTGFSMGSVVTLASIERFAWTYDGALAACAVGAGAPRAFDGTLAVAAAYDAVFGWPASWGTPSNVRDDLDFETEVLPVLAGQLSAPGGLGRFEFMRLAVGAPEGPEWPFSIFFFATEGRAELERRAGGPPVQNADHTYRLSAADRARLASLGVTGAVADGWLADMMAGRVRADRSARFYVQRFADYTGLLRRPVLTFGTTVDALVAPANISAYNETVRRDRLVANAWTSGVGHCNFTIEQTVTAVRALDAWVRTGNRPGPFPPSQGFVEFTPPPWPQP